MKQLFIQSIFVVGLLLSSIATASNFPTEEPMGGEPFGHSVKKISDGLYVFRWWVYRNVFVVTDEGVIVTDPMNPKAAKLLRSEIRKVTDKPVKYVVYSHNHHDHISGGNIFKEEGATFVGHKNVLKELGDHPSPVTPLPDITFEDSYTLELGGRTLELTYFGPNHGESLAVMSLPKEKISFIVDIVTPRRVAFRAMPDVLRTTVKLPQYENWQYYKEWLPMNVERIWAYYHMGW
ncbi:MAG: MBL fold metallo-hydrolase [Oceanicoccus sp.]